MTTVKWKMENGKWKMENKTLRPFRDLLIMPANQYQFLTKWHVKAPRELLYEILKESKNYPRWWPEVYLGAEFEPSGRADHVGKSYFTAIRRVIAAVEVGARRSDQRSRDCVQTLLFDQQHWRCRWHSKPHSFTC